MVTEADVWEALAGVPDPEIPVASLVDLGVIKSVAVEDGHVARHHVDVPAKRLEAAAHDLVRCVERLETGRRSAGVRPEHAWNPVSSSGTGLSRHRAAPPPGAPERHDLLTPRRSAPPRA